MDSVPQNYQKQKQEPHPAMAELASEKEGTEGTSGPNQSPS